MNNGKNRKRIYSSFTFNLLIVVVGVIGSFFAFTTGYQYANNVVTENANRKQNPTIRELTMDITKATTLEDIATILEEKAFIRYGSWFKLQGKVMNIEDKLIPGNYSVSSNMSNGELFDLFTKEQVEEATIKFTIPEGFTIPQIAERLEKAEIVSKEDFIKALNEKNYDYPFLKDIPQDAKYKLEGYLFPDTYIVRKGVTPEEIIVMMLNRFDQVTKQYSTYLHNSTYSIHDIVTIASIIQQEAKLAEERPIISGVIYNRLESDMKLQMCSTIQYALEKRKANLSYDDLAINSSYNTYTHAGIPLGPICSPGEESLQAALMPEDNDYFFFVLMDTESGKHAFGKNASEHEKNKIRYKQTIDKNFYE